MPTQGTFLHLTSGVSAGDSVRLALRRLRRKESVTRFNDGLSEGPLTDVDAGAASRVRWWNRGPEPKMSASEARSLDDAHVWNRVRADKRYVVVWHGSHPTERLFALRACWQLRGQASRVHEVRISLPRREGVPSFCGAVAIVEPEVLADAWPCVRVQDVAARAKRWVRIRSRPGDWVRELRGERIVHLPPDAYDAALLRACAGEWTRSIMVVGRVLCDVACGDFLLVARIDELLQRGELKGRGKKNRLRLPEEVVSTRAPCST